VELDCEAGFVAEEVEDVAAEGMLAAEFQAGQAAVSQAAPEKAFGKRRVAAKMPGFRFCRSRELGLIGGHGTVFTKPSPGCCAATLSQRERDFALRHRPRLAAVEEGVEVAGAALGAGG